jgi:pimeloyl-ACP methyl ester carboxylesterase
VLTLRLDELYADYLRSPRRRKLALCCCWPGEALSRCAGTARFSVQLAAAAAASAAPWVLAAVEAATMVLVYFLTVPNALGRRQGWEPYAYSTAVGDLVLLSLARAVAVLATYALRPWLLYSRPYLLTTAAYAAVAIPFAAAKIRAIKRGACPHSRAAPLVAVCALAVAFSAAHVVAAQGVVAWARRRWLLGLASPAARPQAEQSWLAASAAAEAGGDGDGGGGGGGGGGGAQPDVAPEALADPDSLFLDDDPPQGPRLRVHYKIALPQGAAAVPGPGLDVMAWWTCDALTYPSAAVVLIHAFGGGVHSWRLVMQAVADAAGVGVVAFDRPGFGLTSRPPLPPPGAPAAASPYSLASHAALAARLAAHLGLRRVVFVGAEDGALVALMAAAALLRSDPAAAAAGSPGGRPIPPGGPAAPGTPPPSASSLGGSLDLGWMGSAVSPASRKSLLTKLLHGEWESAEAAPSGLAGAAGPQPGGGGAGAGAAPGEPQSDLEADVEVGATGEEEEAQEPWAPLPPHTHARARSPAPAGAAEPEGAGPGPGGAAPQPRPGGSLPLPLPLPLLAVSVAGLALLHPDLSGRCGSRLLRVLAGSSLGRRVLRDLLGSELGSVADRAAWADEEALTPEVLALYRRPLRCAGWDGGLLGVSRAAAAGRPAGELAALLAEVCAGGRLPVAVVTGEADRAAPPAAAAALARRLRGCGARAEVLPRCGRVSHEERPAALAAALARLAVEALR